jgi:hypothetical protein
MIEQIQHFLAALDAALVPHAAQGERLELYHIGRSAVMLHFDLKPASGGTRDFDVVQIGHPPSPLTQQALMLFGKGTDGASRLGLFWTWSSTAFRPSLWGSRSVARKSRAGGV